MFNTKSRFRMIVSFVIFTILLFTFEVNAASLPPDPDNAALLYYQAFLHLPDYNYLLIDPVLRGGDPNSAVRDYLEDSREAIELAISASQISQCNWGIQYSQGGRALTTLIGQQRFLTYILNVDARTLAFDGDYRTSFERFLCMRKLAQHIDDGIPLNYLTSLAIDGMAQRCIQEILGSMIPDADILEWLRGRLAFFESDSHSLITAIEMDLELSIQNIRSSMDPFDTIDQIREQMIENAEDQNSIDDILNLSDDELIALAREPYDEFLNSIFKVIDSEMSYVYKYEEIQRLNSELIDEHPAVYYIIYWTGGTIDHINRMFDIQFRHMAQFNALKAAIDIYLEVTEAGQLPEMLPANLPKDPFSGEDFEYEVTNHGFILRCRQVEIGTNELWEYEFTVTQ